MNITILDGFTMNPGDLSYQELQKLGNLTVYDRTAPELVYERAKDSELVLTNKTVLSGEMIRRLSKLKYIGVLATGTNIVDLDTAHELGIIVTNIPSYSTMSVAQNVFALLLAIVNSPEHYAEQFNRGKWAESRDFSYSDTPLIELAGKRMGIIGYGHIGKAVACIARAFGMEVCVSSRRPQEELPDVKKLDTDEIFSECDVISLHCPLTPDTENLVDARRLALMKPSAILINTGRGSLVDEYALADALHHHRILGAGLDVLRQEPPEADNPLIGAPHLVVTPHISWATKEARTRLLQITTDNVRAFLAGTPQNEV